MNKSVRVFERRQVRRDEVMMFGQRYADARLQKYNQAYVNVDYDPANPESLMVYDLKNRLICEAKKLEMVFVVVGKIKGKRNA